MPDIRAFRGIRYDLGQVGSLSDVVAPWSGDLAESLSSQLYKQHPANAIRLVRNREEPADEAHSRFDRAAKFLRNWRRQGVLMQDASPAVYVYHQTFDVDGVVTTRRGFAACMRLEPLGESVRLLTEQGPLNQREVAAQRQLLERSQTNFTPVVAAYPDDTQTLQSRLDALIYDVAPREATDAEGVTHRLWPVTDLATITDIVADVSNLQPSIVAGREIYEAAIEYRNGLPDLDDEDPANYVLTFFMNLQNAAAPTLPSVCKFGVSLPVKDLVSRLQGHFELEEMAPGLDAGQVWEDLQLQEQSAAACYAAIDQKWVLVKLTADGRAEMACRCADHSDEWQALNASVMQRLLLPSLQADGGSWSFPRSPSELSRLVEGFEAGSGLAVMVMPPNADELQWFTSLGEPLPDLGIGGRPLPVSGLVFSPLA